ncbi:MAG: ABC transporter substrate-binding protein [Acidimicrobiales bacterium]|jgi:peptide/nickel transport system substrate-binding protein
MDREASSSGHGITSIREFSRRDFLRYSGGAVLLGAAGGSLGACGSSSSSSTTSSGPAGAAGKPKRGGTLTAGLTGGDSSDTIDGQQGVNNVDFARIVSLYDALVIWDLNCQPQLSLAESIEPNADFKLWTIKLRPDIVFHNGKPLTADDVIFSFQRVVAGNYGGASSVAPCDIKNMKKVNNLTVQIPCFTPFATFVESILGYYYYLSIFPVGWTKTNPVGTGPFKYEKFEPGVSSTFTANKNYWQNGTDGKPLPYVDAVVIEDYPSETTQVSALQSGEVHLVNLLSSTSIPTVEGFANVLIAEAGGMTPFTMRVDQAPFNDQNVRLGLRWAVNRQEMINTVFSGHGRLGNDIFSPFDPEIDKSIPQREQDLDKAKFYLKKADVLGSNLTMQTADIAQGTLKVAQVMQEQLAQSGLLNISLDQVTVTSFYGKEYLQWTFAQDYWYYAAYLPQVSEATLPISPFNETHFASPASNPLPPVVGKQYIDYYNQAVSTSDVNVRTEIAHEMQMIDYNWGGYIIPYFPPVIDGYAKNIGGVTPSLTGLSLSNYGFQRFWFT